MFFDMGFYRQEILLDELSGLRVLVRLGIQPSTSPSSRGRTEIDQNRSVLFLSSDQGLINIFAEIHSHTDLLRTTKNYRRGYSMPHDEYPLHHQGEGKLAMNYVVSI